MWRKMRVLGAVHRMSSLWKIALELKSTGTRLFAGRRQWQWWWSAAVCCNLWAESELAVTNFTALEFCLSGTASHSEGSQIKIIVTPNRVTIWGTCSNSEKSQAERKSCWTWVPFTKTSLCIWSWSPCQGSYLLVEWPHILVCLVQPWFMPIVLAILFTLKSVLV